MQLDNKTRSSAVMAEEISLKIRESELWQAVSGLKIYVPKTEFSNEMISQ